MKAIIQTADAKITGIPPALKRAAWIIGIIFLIIVGIFAFVKIRAKIKEKEERKKISYIEGGGELRPNFNPGEHADKMFDVMDGVFTLADTKLTAACELMQLSDNEIIAVHNYWNQHLYDRNNETLYKMMKAELNTPAFVIGGSNCWDQLMNRLSRLNLISK